MAIAVAYSDCVKQVTKTKQRADEFKDLRDLVDSLGYVSEETAREFSDAMANFETEFEILLQFKDEMSEFHFWTKRTFKSLEDLFSSL